MPVMSLSGLAVWLWGGHGPIVALRVQDLTSALLTTSRLEQTCKRQISWNEPHLRCVTTSNRRGPSVLVPPEDLYEINFRPRFHGSLRSFPARLAARSRRRVDQNLQLER